MNKTSIPTYTLGVDLGDKNHSICVVDQEGKITSEFKTGNLRERLFKVSKKYPGARIAMEVGTHSPWVSRLFKESGHEVIVANARELRAIYSNKRKCDRRDAQMLAKLGRIDPSLLHPIRHGDESCQRDLLLVKARACLVRQRTTIILSIRNSLKSLGMRLPSPSTASFAKKARAVLESEDAALLATFEPSLECLDTISTSISEYDRKIREAAKRHPATELLQQVAGVGPVTSLCYVLSIDDPERFTNNRDVGAYIGMVPGRDQSGDSDVELPITKTGNRHLRTLLVQAAQYILGAFGPDSDLRSFGQKLMERGGKGAKKKAVIAVARKLSVLLLTLWKTGATYRPIKQQAV